MPSITLNNSVMIPQLGFGTYQIEPGETRAATEAAIASGYRHIDTAAAYGNEAGVGQAVNLSGISREEFFLTTKLRNADQGYENTLSAFERSRRELGVDYVDLYLIHWPYPRHGLFVESWLAIEKLYGDGVVRAIGVSNFLEDHLKKILSEGSVLPAVNQIEIHPTFQQPELSDLTTQLGIAVQAYSPLGQGADLDNDVVRGIAHAHAVSPAQVVLRWHMQRGFIAIPKSTNRARIEENIDILDFSLDDGEMESIDGLDGGNRTSWDPATFDFPQR
jgi:diketogulonate reductase-like aldo/keto reductase